MPFILAGTRWVPKSAPTYGNVTSSSLRSLRNPTFRANNDNLEESYEYDSKQTMGSKTPDDHRRGPNGMEKEFALRCKLF